jgi:hypothetical protein
VGAPDAAPTATPPPRADTVSEKVRMQKSGTTRDEQDGPYAPSRASIREPDAAFLLKEYELLRMSIENELAELRKIDRWVLVATAAFWTWVFLDPSNRTGPLVLSVPAVVVLLLGFKIVAITNAIELTSRYLCDYPEGLLGGQWRDGKQVGFERYFHDACKNNYRGLSTIQKWSLAYYLTLLLANVVLAFTGAGLLPTEQADPRSGSVTIQVD